MKPYISWSQLDLFSKNPSRYIAQYFGGKWDEGTPEMKYGGYIAKLIEDGKHKELLPDLIVYSASEHKIMTTIGDVPTLSYIDSYDTETNTFREYKTGKAPWTHPKVYKHGQLLFYAVVIRKVTGKMPEYCHLDWIETVDHTPKTTLEGFSNNKEIKVTGKITTFERRFTERELDMFEERIIETYQKIKDEWEKYDRKRNTPTGDDRENEAE
jgi:hypothetical protein